MAREPGYCHHKPTNQAYVRLNRKAYYLGEYGSDESKERYKRLKAEWLVKRNVGPFVPKAQSGPTLAEVCLAYLDHAESYYANSSEYVNLKLAIGPVSALYATMRASEFGILQYRACRDWWLSDPKRSRQYVNKQMKRLLRVIKWGVGEGMIPPTVHQSLQCVAPLKRGRTNAPEAPPVKPVDDSVIEATLPHMTNVVAAMVRFQQYTGCRPGEVCKIKPSMVNRSGDVWEINLVDHKTAYRGKERTIFCGPAAQDALRPFLLRDADAYCFSPRESEEERLEKRSEARKTSRDQGNRRGYGAGTRKPAKRAKPLGECYTTQSYGKAIAYACKKAFPAPEHFDTKAKKRWDSSHAWAPNRVRHTFATKVRQLHGIEAASNLLGHSGLEVTQVYAEKDREKAISIARAI